MRTRTVNPDTVAPPAGNYSHAVRLELDGAAPVFVSGQLTLDAQGRLVIGSDVTDMAQLAAMREVRAWYLPEEPPASTPVGVSGLVLPGALLEVEVVAAVATGS